MNVFVLDLDTEKAAQYHNNRHLVKMILESAQILSTAVQLNQPNEELYKIAYPKHPVVIKATQNRSNFIWVANLAKELCREYTFRAGKIHKSLPVINKASLYSSIIPFGELEFAQAMPEEFKDKDPVVAYRTYYILAKDRDKNGKRMDEWFPREKPNWYYG